LRNKRSDYRGWFFLIHRGDKTVTSLRERLNEAGCIGIVFQGGADLSNRKVQALIEIYKSVLTPNLLGELAPGYDLASTLHQQYEYLGRLWREIERNAIAP
jgi:hypothetical protein